jgi:hypothetical protein
MRASLVVHSETLDGDAIARAFEGEVAACVWRKGEPVSVRSPAAGLHAFSGVAFDSPLPTSTWFDDHVDWLIRFVEHNENAFATLAPTCTFRASIGASGTFSGGGPAWTPEQLSLLGARSVHLHFSYYADPDAVA